VKIKSKKLSKSMQLTDVALIDFKEVDSQLIEGD